MDCLTFASGAFLYYQHLDAKTAFADLLSDMGAAKSRSRSNTRAPVLDGVS